MGKSKLCIEYLKEYFDASSTIDIETTNKSLKMFVCLSVCRYVRDKLIMYCIDLLQFSNKYYQQVGLTYRLIITLLPRGTSCDREQTI